MSWVMQQTLNCLKGGDLVRAYQHLEWGFQERFYERWYGIDTAEKVEVEDLGLDPDRAHLYEACSYNCLHKVFRMLAPKTSDNNEALLDIGCGKGRVLAVASTYNYATVYGVDIDADLVGAARQNIDRLGDRRKSQKVEIIQADATTFEIPPEVTTIFMFYPLKGDALVAAMEKVQASLEAAPRNLRMACAFTPPELYTDFPWLEERKQDGFKFFYPGPYLKDMTFSVWQSKTHPATGAQEDKATQKIEHVA